MRAILAIILCCLLSPHVFAAPAAELQLVWGGTYEAIYYEVSKSYFKGPIKVEEIYYYSRPYQGKPSKIFGYFCFPATTKQKLPAILLSHGGGGGAELSPTVNWAKRGYAVLAIDLPGKGEQRALSKSTGPDMDVSNLLKTTPDLTDNYLVHAVAAARNGITFLAQRPEVDPGRIGMVGLSWGGVLTLLTNGQDTRLKTAVNVFGAGYIPEGCAWQLRFDTMTNQEKELWDVFIDPKNFLATQHAPILFVTGTNDHCYYLPTFQKSFTEVTVPKKLYLVSNLRHQFLPDTQAVVWRWLDSKLKYADSFPEVKIAGLYTKGTQKLIVPVIATASTFLKDVTLYYTQGQPNRWTKRHWKSITAHYDDGMYYFGIPHELIKPEMLFFVTARDDQGGASSTPVHSIFEVKIFGQESTYAMSSPIQNINVHEPPLNLLGIKYLTDLYQLYFSKENKTYYLLGQKQEKLSENL